MNNIKKRIENLEKRILPDKNKVDLVIAEIIGEGRRIDHCIAFSQKELTEEDKEEIKKENPDCKKWKWDKGGN